MLVFEWNFLGLSDEVKPMSGDKVIDGSTYYECDTGKFFIYYKDTWYEQTFVTEDGVNVFIYKYLIHRMFGKAFDSNISKANVITPPMASEISFVTDLPSSITSALLYGDTFQQTYTGKNLFSGYTKGINLKPTDGSQTLSTKAACSDYIPLDITGDKSFIISGLPTDLFNFVAAYNNSNQFLGRTGAGAEGERLLTTSSFSIGTPQGTGDIVYVRVPVYENQNVPGVIDDIDDAKIQLESGSTPTSYEPYVGSTDTDITPAPNPDYPQDVKVVTSDQTVTINEDEPIVVPLGSVELCKIGTNQDYIYKNGDDWYVHKVIGKKTITTIDSIYNSAGTGYIGSQIQVTGMKSNSRTNGYCNRFTPFNSPSGATSEGITFGASNKNIYMVLKESRMESSTKANWETWLSNNETIVYYPLASSSDTKITNTSLITKLNSLIGYELPIGTNNVVITAAGLSALLKLTILERE